jgi:hypothetical protein
VSVGGGQQLSLSIACDTGAGGDHGGAGTSAADLTSGAPQKPCPADECTKTTIPSRRLIILVLGTMHRQRVDFCSPMFRSPINTVLIHKVGICMAMFETIRKPTSIKLETPASKVTIASGGTTTVAARVAQRYRGDGRSRRRLLIRLTIFLHGIAL